jgi:hypothetical protein
MSAQRARALSSLRSRWVALDVDNPDLLLRPGMGAEVRIGPDS